MEALSLAPWSMAQQIPVASDEDSLVNAARHDSEAMAQLFRRYYPPITQYIHRRTGDRAVAEDLSSEVFLAMVRYLPRYRIGNTPFRAWLYRIATNQVNRWASRKRRWNWLPLGNHAATEKESTSEEAAHIRLALLKLPVHYQSALALHYLEDLSLETVSQVLGCAIGTVKSRLARGRAMLAKLLTEHENWHEHKTEEQS